VAVARAGVTPSRVRRFPATEIGATRDAARGRASDHARRFEAWRRGAVATGAATALVLAAPAVAQAGEGTVEALGALCGAAAGLVTGLDIRLQDIVALTPVNAIVSLSGSGIGRFASLDTFLGRAVWAGAIGAVVLVVGAAGWLLTKRARGRGRPAAKGAAAPASLAPRREAPAGKSLGPGRDVKPSAPEPSAPVSRLTSRAGSADSAMRRKLSLEPSLKQREPVELMMEQVMPRSMIKILEERRGVIATVGKKKLIAAQESTKRRPLPMPQGRTGVAVVKTS
jgi:hypothetical protein